MYYLRFQCVFGANSTSTKTWAVGMTPTYFYCEFALRTHFQCVIRTYDLKNVENGKQLVFYARQDHEYSYEMESVSALTNQITCLEKKLILKCVDSVIGKSNLKFEICYIILRKTTLFLSSMFYFNIKSV